MAPSPSLVFVQTDNGVKAYRLYSGMVVPDLRPETLAHLDVTDNHEKLRDCLTSMTVEGVVQTIDRLSMKISTKKPLKKPLIESFLGQWEKMKARAVEVGQVTSQMLASSSNRIDDDEEVYESDDFLFAFINPYTDTMEFVILDTTKSLADICNVLTEKYYRENEPLPRPSINVMLPFGKADFDPMTEDETPHVSSLQASSSTEHEPPTAFKAFSGKPMKLNEKDNNENVKTFYLNEKGIDTIGKVVVEFPKRIGMSGDFYIFHFEKDDQWKALYDAMAEKTPIVLSDNDAVFCLRLPNKGSKTVSYETIGSWASLPSPLHMEIDMGLSGGGSGTRKSKDKVKMIAFQKAEVLKLAEKMKSEDRSAKSIDAIIAQNSEKMDLIWKMYESGNSMNVVETIMGGMPKQSLNELFEFSSSKPEQKLEHVVSVMLKSYIPETVKAHSALEATMSSSGSCLNLALKSFLVKNTGSVNWEALKRMADVEIKARLMKPSDMSMG